MPIGDSTSQAALESPQNGQGDQTSQQPGQPSAAPAKQDKPNWYDDPKFRETQSKLQKQADEARQQAALAYQQNQQLLARLRELEERDLTQDEKVQLQLRREAEEKQQWQQAYYALAQQQQLENEKRTALRELLADGDYPDVREDDLMDTKSATEAAKKAARLQRERSGKAQQEQEQRRLANRTDLGGGGRPPAADDDFDMLLSKAKTADDHARLLMWAQRKERR